MRDLAGLRYPHGFFLFLWIGLSITTLTFFIRCILVTFIGPSLGLETVGGRIYSVYDVYRCIYLPNRCDCRLPFSPAGD